MEDCKTSTPVPVDSPLHPSRVGVLLKVNDTVRNVETLVRSHIKKQESQEQGSIELLFSGNKHSLTDLSSPWHGFTHDDIKARLSFLRGLLKTVQYYQEVFARLQHKFTFHWRKDPRYRISEVGKTYLTKIQSLWEKMERALSIISPTFGPYPLHLQGECSHYIQLLRSTVVNISLGNKLDEDQIADWIVLDMSQPPILIFQPPEESISQSRQGSLDLESGEPGDQSFWGKWRWLLVKEIQLIIICLLVAILYSALKRDPQTGFQIAAFLFAIGTTLVPVLRMYLKRKKDKEAKIRLH
ncbi:hypothetical protein BDV29DRAFT_176222 [Aspergillus leporis]|jgi:hypothetical protein|uniref:Uncharacterized protein n=1 Tax=Aspergillus leporis TaxID=41062 RepID=A0A5N5X136_9EURO|nr:hypothetical protein BDV29DRAFT_176222 [Aspergillus leporis]